MVLDPRQLKPSAACRLLNSTPLGEVIGDRQLYRHRMRAGFRIGDGKTVDLVRYAAATRDFNPLHWDHVTAVEAGLPGTVVHGLLMYAWIVQEAARATGSDVREAKVRFRSALHPGEPATLSAAVDGNTVKLELARDGAILVSGTATVTGTTE